MKVLVTGAKGFIGPLVVKAFHDAGYSIRTLSIDSPPAGTGRLNVDARQEISSMTKKVGSFEF